LAEEYPFLWIDALYQMVRVEGRVVSVAVMIACGVNPGGSREILAVEPMFDESEDSWRVFFRKLKSCGTSWPRYLTWKKRGSRPI
jgi:putative transposase